MTAATAELKQWVSDSLHTLLQYSAPTVVDYILAASKRKLSGGPAAIEQILVDAGLPANNEVKQFASELHTRLQSVTTNKSLSQHKQLEQQKIAAVRKKHDLLLVDDFNEEIEEATKQEKERQKSERRRLREEQRVQAAADNNAAATSSSTNVTANKDEAMSTDDTIASDDDVSKLTPAERAELERQQDLAERDAFAKRITDRDKRKRDGGDKDNATPTATIDELRKKARQEYFVKREAQQLELTRRTLDAEEQLFGKGHSQLSERERNELQRKRQVLELAQQRKQASTATHEQQYSIPTTSYEQKDGKIDQQQKMSLLHTRYNEPANARSANSHRSDVEQFEQHQSKAAVLKFGARDKHQQQHVNGDDRKELNELVFDDAMIDFVKSEMIAGTEGESPALVAPSVKQLTKHELIVQERKRLPIYPYREALLQAIRDYQVIIIVGETGSGKTTQVMQYLYEDGYCKDGKMVGCTQPRRVAAMSVAARVADEVNVKLGNEVGYTIRFEDNTNERTRIKYMTDGMLLREFLTHPDLSPYSVIMIDEAHERTLHTDILFGLIKDIAKYRSDLKILISSATLDADKFSRYFSDAEGNEAPIFIIPGRRYPVDIFYTKAPEADYIDAVLVTCFQIHTTQPAGDILVFLTGQDEIEQCDELLQQRAKQLGNKIAELMICPIYSTLPTEMQTKIFAPTPAGARKIVLATNIAETSLTINGIVYVIDPGFVKQKSYNPRTSIESLVVVPVSRASANQRAGRAGRVAAGKCFRLYTAHAYASELEENTVPEIQRTNLGNVVLQLKSLGIDDLIHFDFMDPPPAETLIRALEQLYALGALNDRGELTKLGRRMAELPLEPQLSKILIASEKYKAVNSIMTICAMLSVNNSIFYRPKDKQIHADNAHKSLYSPVGDHLTLLNTYNSWEASDYSMQWCYENFVQYRSMRRAQDVRIQLEAMLDRVEVDATDSDTNNIDDVAVRKAIASGYFYHTAHLDRTGQYKTAKTKQTVYMHPSSCLFKGDDVQLPRWLIYHELVLTQKEYMRSCIEIDPSWLTEVAPHYYTEQEVADQSKQKRAKGVGRAAIPA